MQSCQDARAMLIVHFTSRCRVCDRNTGVQLRRMLSRTASFALRSCGRFALTWKSLALNLWSQKDGLSSSMLFAMVTLSARSLGTTPSTRVCCSSLLAPSIAAGTLRQLTTPFLNSRRDLLIVGHLSHGKLSIPNQVLAL